MMIQKRNAYRVRKSRASVVNRQGVVGIRRIARDINDDGGLAVGLIDELVGDERGHSAAEVDVVDHNVVLHQLREGAAL